MNQHDVNSDRFEQAHGRKPRGRGGWAFFFDGARDIDEAFWAQGTYAEARRQAVAEGNRRGAEFAEVGE